MRCCHFGKKLHVHIMAVPMQIVSLFVLLSCLQAAVAIDCYECRYAEETKKSTGPNATYGLNATKSKMADANCKLTGDKYKSSSPKKASNCKTCDKGNGKIYLKYADTSTVTISVWWRGCEVTGASKGCTTDLKPWETKTKTGFPKAEEVTLTQGSVCVCPRENCNGAGRVTFGVALILLAVMPYILI